MEVRRRFRGQRGKSRLAGPYVGAAALALSGRVGRFGNRFGDRRLLRRVQTGGIGRIGSQQIRPKQCDQRKARQRRSDRPDGNASRRQPRPAPTGPGRTIFPRAGRRSLPRRRQHRRYGPGIGPRRPDGRARLQPALHFAQGNSLLRAPGFGVRRRVRAFVQFEKPSVFLVHAGSSYQVVRMPSASSPSSVRIIFCRLSSA